MLYKLMVWWHDCRWRDISKICFMAIHCSWYTWGALSFLASLSYSTLHVYKNRSKMRKSDYSYAKYIHKPCSL